MKFSNVVSGDIDLMAIRQRLDSMGTPVDPKVHKESRDYVAKIALASDQSMWNQMGNTMRMFVEETLPFVDITKLLANEIKNFDYNAQIKFSIKRGLKAFIVAQDSAVYETAPTETEFELTDVEVRVFPTVFLPDLENGVGPTLEELYQMALQAIITLKCGYIYRLLMGAIPLGGANTETVATAVSQAAMDRAIDWIQPRTGLMPMNFCAPAGKFSPVTTTFGYGNSIAQSDDIYRNKGVLESYRTVPLVAFQQPLDEFGEALKDEDGSEWIPLSTPYDIFSLGANKKLGGLKIGNKTEIKRYEMPLGKDLRKGFQLSHKFAAGYIDEAQIASLQMKNSYRIRIS